MNDNKSNLKKHINNVFKERDKLQLQIDSIISDFEKKHDVEVLTSNIDGKLVIGVFIDVEQVIHKVTPDGVFIDADGLNEVDLGNE